MIEGRWWTKALCDEKRGGGGQRHSVMKKVAAPVWHFVMMSGQHLFLRWVVPTKVQGIVTDMCWQCVVNILNTKFRTSRICFHSPDQFLVGYLSEFLTYQWLLLLLIKWFELHYILGDRCGRQEGYCHICTSTPNQAFSEDPGI